MDKRRPTKQATLISGLRPLKFDQRLVLNQWLINLFEARDFAHLAEKLKDPQLEGLDEDNVHRFHHQMKLLWEFEDFPGDTLLG
jgi:hypothetical protein